METVGPYQEKYAIQIAEMTKTAPTFFVLQVLEHLRGKMDQVSSRVRFMIMNLEDLRKNKWVPLLGNKGPTTLEQVRKDAEDEELQKEEERREVCFFIMSCGYFMKIATFSIACI